MCKKLLKGIIFFNFTLVLTKEAELPLCPTNVLYFPQNLPMHCRMPTNSDLPSMSGALPTVPPFYQIPASDKHPPLPIQIAMPPGVPGSMPMPGPMPVPGPMAIPGPTGPIPFPGPMPLPPGPAHKLPVIVMPFYSPDPSFKKTARPQHSYRPRKWKIRHRRRRPHIYSPPDTSSSTDAESSDEKSSSSSSEYKGWWRGRKNNRRFNEFNRMRKSKRNQKRPLLTPVLQYVTKDGYVIFEKKISKNEAKDWLSVKKDEKVEENTRRAQEAIEMESNEPNDIHTAEKVMIPEDNVEVITNRNVHRMKRLKAYRNKAARKKNVERPV